MKKRQGVFLGIIGLGIIGAGIGISLDLGVTPERRDKTRRHLVSVDAPLPNNQSLGRCQKLNFDGFTALHSEGSALINFRDFNKNLKSPPQKLYVVNLLEEEVYYYKDRTLKWYGLKCTQPNLGSVMTEKTYHQIRKFFIRLANGYPLIHDDTKFQTEGQILKDRGIHYYRPLKNLKNRSDWLGDHSYMDEVIKIFETIPEDGHLYIHCENGRGRTTTFLVLYDIFKNGKKMPLKDIVDRHYCIGREDLFNTIPQRNGTWTKEALSARKAIVENFYDYMTSSEGYPHKNWAQWCNHKGLTQTKIQVHR